MYMYIHVYGGTPLLEGTPLLGLYLWEVSEYFRHLISSLPTAHIDDDIRVGELGQCLGDDSLATAKGTRNGSSPSLYTPVYGETDTLQKM